MKDPRERLRRTTGSADIARRLGVDLPPFTGPLVAFDPGSERSSGGPVCLGGDLHAVHPDTGGPGVPPDRDEALDMAAVTLFDGEGRLLDIPATEGVWCARLEGPAPDRALYFLLSDSRGRLRTWLLLSPARTMIGIAHLWLPSVPPPGPPFPGAPGNPSRTA